MEIENTDPIINHTFYPGTWFPRLTEEVEDADVNKAILEGLEQVCVIYLKS